MKGKQEMIEKQMKYEEEKANNFLGVKRLVGQGKQKKEKYLDLMRRYFEAQQKFDDNINPFDKYCKSKSTPAKRIILDEVGGELISVLESNERNEGIIIDNLGKLEKEILNENLEQPPTSQYSFPYNLIPIRINVSEFQNGSRLSIGYTKTQMYTEDVPINTKDSFDFFDKKLLGRNLLFLRFNTPVGEALVHHGGTFALGLRYVSYEADRYGGLIAIQELENPVNPKEITKKIIDRCVKRLQEYVSSEKERSLQYLENLRIYHSAKEALGIS